MSRVVSAPRARRTAVAISGLLVALFAAGPAFAAPDDGRHWELISGAAGVGREASSMYPDVSPDGNTVVWTAQLPQSSTSQGGISASFVGRRVSTGWTATDASLPGSNGPLNLSQYSIPVVMPPGAARLLVAAPGQQDPTAPVSDLARRHLYEMTPGAATGRAIVRPPAEGVEATAVPGQQTLASVYFGPQDFDIVADDGTAATPFTFVRRDADGATSVASRLPDDSVTDSDSQATAAAPLYIPPQEIENSPRNPRAGVGRQPISSDGKRFYFNAYVGAGRQDKPADAIGYPLQPLFVRDGNTTVAVSKSQLDDEPKAARLIGATADGDISYFVAGAGLDDPQQGAGVYRYQLSTGGTLTRLTSTPLGTSIDDLAISDAFASRDGSSVYFVTASDLGGGASAGGRNAYVWRSGGLRFIADLGSDGRLQRVSRDGAFAVFRTSSDLGVAGAATGGFAQLFRYAFDAGAGARLACASCRADGTANAGPSDFKVGEGSLTTVPNNPRGISDDGHVYFTAQDQLASDDPTMGADVYEFTGSATRMLSDGAGGSDVVDNSDDGRAVYVAASRPYVPEDEDGGAVDVYVRRAGADIARPQVVAPCSGDACQGAASAPPTSSAVGSDRAAANENAAPRRRVAPALLAGPSLSRGALRALARGDGARVRVRVRGEGRLSVRATARVRSRRRVVAEATARGRKDAVRIASATIRLNALGRAELRRRGVLVVRIEARYGSKGSRTATVTLREERS